MLIRRGMWFERAAWGLRRDAGSGRDLERERCGGGGCVR